MDASAESDMKRLMSSGNANRTAQVYFDARLAEVKNQLVVANESMYKQLQGRAMELQSILKIIELARE